MPRWCCVRDGSGVRCEDDPGDLASAELAWCHLDGRELDNERWLTTCAGLSPAVIASLLAVETRPRAEVIGDGALVNLRGLGTEPVDEQDRLVSIRLWAEKGRVISVGFRPLAATDAVRARMQAGALHDPGDLIAAFAVAITETLDPEIAALGDAIDACEADLDPARAYAMRRSIAAARSRAIDYRRFVAPQRQALERLAGLEAAWLEEDDRIHLSSAADRFARMAEELEAVRERAALLHEQLTDLKAEQTETRTLILSVVALIFLPLTFLTGLLGMNVEGIPYANESWAFWSVVALCAIVAVGIAAYFIRGRWLR